MTYSVPVCVFLAGKETRVSSVVNSCREAGRRTRAGSE